jgi:hypothetical protein
MKLSYFGINCLSLKLQRFSILFSLLSSYRWLHWRKLLKNSASNSSKTKSSIVPTATMKVRQPAALSKPIFSFAKLNERTRYRFPSLFAVEMFRHFGPRILISQIKSQFLTGKLSLWTFFKMWISGFTNPRITRAACIPETVLLYVWREWIPVKSTHDIFFYAL